MFCIKRIKPWHQVSEKHQLRELKNFNTLPTSVPLMNPQLAMNSFAFLTCKMNGLEQIRTTVVQKKKYIAFFLNVHI